MDWLKALQNAFSYKLEQPGNGYPHTCTIWNGYGLSVTAEEGTAEKAIELAIMKAQAGEWA